MMIYTDKELLEAMPQDQFDSTMRACLAHADDLRRQGRLLETQMLEGAHAARTVRKREGRQTVVDGPFTETKELLAGFNLIVAEDLDAALAMAAEFPWTETGSIEVREILEVETVRKRVSGFHS
jgi:hypothetical protein